MKQTFTFMSRMCIGLLFLLIAHVTYAQSRTVTGKVTDPSTGAGISGVSVTVRGTTVGTTTADDGSFRLDLPQNARSVTFSAVGYGEQEVQLGSSDVLSVNLQAGGARSLDEVVVVGYGTRRKSDLTGSVGVSTWSATTGTCSTFA